MLELLFEFDEDDIGNGNFDDNDEELHLIVFFVDVVIDYTTGVESYLINNFLVPLSVNIFFNSTG